MWEDIKDAWKLWIIIGLLVIGLVGAHYQNLDCQNKLDQLAETNKSLSDIKIALEIQNCDIEDLSIEKLKEKKI